MKNIEIQQDLEKAMKAHDELTVSTLRLLNSSIRYFEIEKGKDYIASDEDVMKIIQKEAKKRTDAIELYKKGNRQDLVDKETKELAILKAYLPEQMSDEELKILIDEAIQQTGSTSLQDMGKIMSNVMPKVKGKADGKRVGEMVKVVLNVHT